MSSLDLDLEEPETYGNESKRMYSIIQNYLQPRRATTLQQTSAAIQAMLPIGESSSTDVWMFGELCIELAERIPYHHPLQLKLVQLLDYLKLSPHLCQIAEDKDYQVNETTNQKIGRYLLCLFKKHKRIGHFYRHSRFGESMRDNLVGPDPDNPGRSVNFQCFAAHLAEYRVMTDNPTWAIWALRDAHEEVCKEDDCRQLVRDEEMMGAAQWILWFGQALFKQLLFPREVDPHDLTHSLRPGELYPGKGGLSFDRWRFWKDGFASVAAGAGGEKEGYGEECVRVSAKAVGIMEALEENMTF